jgi:hypothetical protein
MGEERGQNHVTTKQHRAYPKSGEQSRGQEQLKQQSQYPGVEIKVSK